MQPVIKISDIHTGQFALLFVDHRYGHIYDHNLALFQNTSESTQKVYTVFDSLEAAIQFANNKIVTRSNTEIDIRYLIFDHQEKVIVNTDCQTI